MGTRMGKSVILCCREKHRREVLAARTPNRLRWSGREYSGDRENHGEGTRQNAPVTSGEGGPPAYTSLPGKGCGGRRDQWEATVY